MNSVSYLNLGGWSFSWGSKPTKTPCGDRTGDSFCEFWSVVKLLLLLSRGRQLLKKGFS